MKKRKTSNKITTILNIRVDIKNLFKAYCAEHGRTMIDVFEEMMLERIKRDIK